MATPPDVSEGGAPVGGADPLSLSIGLDNCSPGKRIAILGGSFDPITTGHLKVACEIVHNRKADEVWIVPCGSRPDKPSLRTPYMHRLLMCHLAVNTTFGSTFPIRVCDIEMGQPEALATYHLMIRLKEVYPTKQFVFVIGADLLSSLKSWGAPGIPDAGERLWRECDFLLMERPGCASDR
jgi:nicotinate (nicotinamide) nucleotide adenylyltransferase